MDHIFVELSQSANQIQSNWIEWMNETAISSGVAKWNLSLFLSVLICKFITWITIIQIVISGLSHILPQVFLTDHKSILYVWKSRTTACVLICQWFSLPVIKNNNNKKVCLPRFFIPIQLWLLFFSKGLFFHGIWWMSIDKVLLRD